MNVNPNPTFNGSFLFSGTETGNDFADFLIGVASNYNQADSQAYYIRHQYAGGFAQDSWRATSTLTLNFGVRWDRMEYWSEKYNQIPTFLPGEQSVVYPNAPVGLVYVGDKGVPEHAGALQQPLLAALWVWPIRRVGKTAFCRSSPADRERPASARATGSTIRSSKATPWPSMSRSRLTG